MDFYNPYMNPYANIRPQQQQVVRVNGEAGATAYQMPPNSSALLLDETAPLVWLVVTDGAGYKTKTPYSITPYETKVVDVESMEERIARLEERLNGKSDAGNAQQKRSEPNATGGKHG